MTKAEGSFSVDHHHFDYTTFVENNLPPSPNFLATLRKMQKAGMVGAVDQSRRLYPSWFDSLEGREAVEANDILADLEASRNIEREHGLGAALDLNHSYVRKLIEWGQLGPERYQNAVRYQASASLH